MNVEGEEAWENKKSLIDGVIWQKYIRAICGYLLMKFIPLSNLY